MKVLALFRDLNWQVNTSGKVLMQIKTRQWRPKKNAKRSYN